MANYRVPKAQKGTAPKPTVEVATQKQVTLEYAGPIPDPLSLAQYDKIVPGAAERILSMAELEQSHRHSLENEYAKASFEDMRLEHEDLVRGQQCAFVVALAMLAVSAFLINQGQALGGTILGGSTLGMIVLAFVSSGRRKKSLDTRTQGK